MDLIHDWTTIWHHFSQSFRTNLHVSIALVGENGTPTVTPIGSLFLNHNQSGFYFEKYPSKLPLHAKTHPEFCILGINSSRLFWFMSLLKGKFKSAPAMKLYGVLGERRTATAAELKRFNRRFKSTSWLKGNKYLWNNMNYARELTFTNIETINLGKMTQ